MTRDFFPRRAFIARNVEAASRTAAFSAPSVNFQRPHAGEEDSRITWIHRQVRAAGVFIGEEHALPMRTAVSRAKDTALLLWSIRMAQSTREHDVGILWIDS